jgi:rubrerythrin
VAKLFRTVLLKLVLEDAIQREERAYRFYETARDHLQEEAPRALLRSLCAEELRHRLKLQELQASGVSEQLRIDAGEGPLPPGPGLGEWPTITPASTATDILQAALRKEQEAARYYRTLSARSGLKAVRDLLSFLAGEEQRHVRWVQQQLQGRQG